MDICGIGFDLTEIDRFESLLERKAFADKVFSEEEIILIRNKGRGAFQTAAGNFAAKEAFLKAVGMGITSLPLKEIEILRLQTGRPFIRLSENLEKRFYGIDFDVTISHTKTTAGAVVIAKRR